MNFATADIGKHEGRSPNRTSFGAYPLNLQRILKPEAGPRLVYFFSLPRKCLRNFATLGCTTILQ